MTYRVELTETFRAGVGIEALSGAAVERLATGERAAKAARFDEEGREGESRAARFDDDRGADSAAPAPVLISTFTSAQEREDLRRALAKKKPLIAVFRREYRQKANCRWRSPRQPARGGRSPFRRNRPARGSTRKSPPGATSSC